MIKKKESLSEDIPSSDDEMNCNEFSCINEMPHVKHRDNKSLTVPRFFIDSKLAINEIQMDVDSHSKSMKNIVIGPHINSNKS